MKDTASIDIKRFQARAQLPKYIRIGAVILFAAVLLAVGVGFYRARSNTDFRMTGFPTELSKDVVATVDFYERKEIDGDSVKYFIKADRASTFSDNHQELENVYLQVFDADGSFNEITAAKAIYVPEADKNFSGYFAGDVSIKTRDALRLRSEQIAFKKSSDTATSEESITFERGNVKGSSFGATLNMARRSVELLREVSFEIRQVDGGVDTVTADHVLYKHAEGIAELNGNARLASRSKDPALESVDATANRVKLTLAGEPDQANELKLAEFFENVNFVRSIGAEITKIRAASAVYEKSADNLNLDRDVIIESYVNGNITRTISGQSAFYSKTRRRAEVLGNVQIVTGYDFVEGDRIDAELNPAGSIMKAVVTGNSNLRQTRNGETTEISSTTLTAHFSDTSEIRSAKSTGRSEVRQISLTALGRQQMTIVAATGINGIFRGAGLFESLKTDGRTVIDMNSPDNGRDSSNKQVAADQVISTFNADGKSLKRAEAIGNAEFGSVPHRSSETNYRVKINAPRFDCDFFATGNTPNVCIASASAKMVRTPSVLREGHGEQVVTATSLTSRFDQTSGNISQMDANGKARFTELERNASADVFTFTSNDEIVKLRGGEPTVWDSWARVKAKEIDWDTKNSRSFYRTAVSTSYYNSKSLGTTAPFGNSEKPVFVTADQAEFDHKAETARYIGRARVWQGGSYVRGDSITITQINSAMNAEGSVQSALFGTKSSGGTEIPVFVSAAKMNYDGDRRVFRYDQNVSLRRGTDRITGRSMTAWLNEKNEMTAVDFENDVVIIQPQRKGKSDHARYTSADEKMVLRGRPATIEDPEKGSFSGAELTIYLKDRRVIGNGISQENPIGRVRNTYKIQ